MIYTTAVREKHLHQILDLQRLNLRSNLSAKDISREGFVTCEHSIDLLSEMNDPYPHIIAINKDVVVGYALVMLRQMRNSLEVLKPMFEQLEMLYPKLDDSARGYFVMGQVCIAKEYRGQGTFYGLYMHMKEVMSPYFDLCVTEVSSLNKRSLKAHENQGFQPIQQYTSPDGHPWEILAWDWR